ncbi:hypothetical protein HOD08_00070 [bacterium]|nr:hypothetical protein [bacterium]
MKVLTKVIAASVLFCCVSQAQAKHEICGEGKRIGTSVFVGAVAGLAGALIIVRSLPSLTTKINPDEVLFVCGAPIFLTCAVYTYFNLSDRAPGARKKLFEKFVDSLKKNDLLNAPCEASEDSKGFEKAFVDYIRSESCRSPWSLVEGSEQLGSLLDDKEDAENLSSKLDEYFPGFSEKNKDMLKKIGAMINKRLRTLHENPNYLKELEEKRVHDLKK